MVEISSVPDHIPLALTRRAFYPHAIEKGEKILWSNEMHRRIRQFAARNQMSRSIFIEQIASFVNEQKLSGWSPKLDKMVFYRVKALFYPNIIKLERAGLLHCFRSDGKQKFGARWHACTQKSDWNGEIDGAGLPPHLSENKIPRLPKSHDGVASLSSRYGSHAKLSQITY